MSGGGGIAGGGIGGISAALALARQGFKVRVLERAAEFGEIGYGLQLGPNAFQTLERLGVRDFMERTAFFPNNLIMQDAVTGKEVSRIHLRDKFLKTYDRPYAVIHRSDLHGALIGPVGGFQDSGDGARVFDTVEAAIAL